jgi:hypothetical protein
LKKKTLQKGKVTINISVLPMRACVFDPQTEVCVFILETLRFVGKVIFVMVKHTASNKKKTAMISHCKLKDLLHDSQVVPLSTVVGRSTCNTTNKQHLGSPLNQLSSFGMNILKKYI